MRGAVFILASIRDRDREEKVYSVLQQAAGVSNRYDILSRILMLRSRGMPMMRLTVAGLWMTMLATAATTSSTSITYDKDVLPILQKNCQSCHRPGEIGPSSFLTYQSTRPWAKAIREAVLTKKMPPWFADPRFGHFANDRRLSEADIKTLVAWVDAGAPEGDAKDMPPPIEWRDGWNIKPDVVVRNAEALSACRRAAPSSTPTSWFRAASPKTPG